VEGSKQNPNHLLWLGFWVINPFIFSFPEKVIPKDLKNNFLLK